jgi:hypothetical protein
MIMRNLSSSAIFKCSCMAFLSGSKKKIAAGCNAATPADSQAM